jgi:hypothetical protein
MKKKCLLPLLTISLALSASAQSYLIDFSTTSGITSGNWNNVNDEYIAATGTTPEVFAHTITNMVDTNGNISAYDLSSTSTATNMHGAFNVTAAPSPFDVATAYVDALYVASGFSYTFKLSDLDPSKTYSLDFFGSRDTTQIRTTNYTISTTEATGDGTTISLTTSGTDVGGTGVNHNIANVASISGISASAGNEIYIDITVAAGDYGYLNAMQITATSIPEPGTFALLAGLTTLAAIALRRRV